MEHAVIQGNDAPDLVAEGLISASKAGRLVAIDGDPANASTVWRWWAKGVLVGATRLRLEGVMIGRRFATSAPAVSRFLARVAEGRAATATADQPAPKLKDQAPSRPESARERAVSAASRRLEAAGI